VGGDREIPVDVRLIAATNRDPEEALTVGKLREDLFYRLNVFPIRLPPLRERGGDITFLANYFLHLLNQQQGAHKRFTAAAIRKLALYSWPGNVRELRNAVQRAFILAHHDSQIDVLHVEDLLEAKPSLNGDPMRLSVGMPIDEAERRLILATLAHFEGNKPLTADTLGISLKTLYNRLKQYQEE
jgi:DNA-binding NtrC family response regulator